MKAGSVTTNTLWPGWGIAALAVAMLLASLGLSIATVALPILARDFSTTVSQVQWVVLAYLLAITAAIVTGARLGDLLGSRRVLLAGFGVFSVASVFCATATSFGLLIAARALQGIGAAVLMALPMAIIRETVSTERTGAAMGLMGTMSAIGTALGPSLGGLLIAVSGWQATFLLLAAAGAAAMGFAALQIPTPSAERCARRARLDMPGMLTLAVTLTAYSLAVTGARGGFDANSAGLIILAVAGLMAFVLIERRQPMPLVRFAALRERTTCVSLLMNLLVSAVMMSTLVVGPFYLTYSLGLDEASAGLVMAVGPATAALSGVPAGRAADRFGAPFMLAFGLVQMTCGLVCLAVLPALVGVWGYVLSLMLLTPGFQLFLAANNSTIMIAASEDERGMISGLLGLSRNLGFMTGASVMGAVFALAAGTRDIARATADTVGGAFMVTFLLAAGLTTLAIVLSVIDRWSSDLRDARVGPI